MNDFVKEVSWKGQDSEMIETLCIVCFYIQQIYLDTTEDYLRRSPLVFKGIKTINKLIKSKEDGPYIIT